VVVTFGCSAINCVSAFTGTIFEAAGADPVSGNLGFATIQSAVCVAGIVWSERSSGSGVAGMRLLALHPHNP
jgi:hypothetical protein